MKQAGRLGAAFALIIGDNELDSKTAILRNMQTKEQLDVPWEKTPKETVQNIRILLDIKRPGNEGHGPGNTERIKI